MCGRPAETWALLQAAQPPRAVTSSTKAHREGGQTAGSTTACWAPGAGQQHTCGSFRLQEAPVDLEAEALSGENQEELCPGGTGAQEQHVCKQSVPLLP